MDFRLHIGIFIQGSMGDALNVSALALGLKRKFPQSDITLFSASSSELLCGSGVIDFGEPLPGGNVEGFVRKVKPGFDIFCTVKYTVDYTFSERALGLPEVLAFKTAWERIYNKKYRGIHEKFLSDIPGFEKFCERHDMTAYDVRRESSGLEYTDDDQFLDLPQELAKVSRGIEYLKFVVVNNSGAAGKMSKSWRVDGWSKVIKHLRKRGLYVIQLGTPGEPELPGIHERFYGTLRETAAMVKLSMFGIFIEGGLAHVAKAVGTKSIVLFGPTPVRVFGYGENINLRGSECRPCWHSDGGVFDWSKVCHKTKQPVETSTPPCMESLDPESVISAADSLLVEKGFISPGAGINV